MAAPPGLHDMLIFLVDDDTINLKLLKTVLAQAGFANTLLFASGEAMLRELETTLPDLILLDIMMPGLDGYEVLGKVKTSPHSANVPVIMVTAVGLDEEMEPLRRCFDLGAVDYLSKPYSTVELLVRIKSALKLEKQRQDLETAAARIRALEKLLPICSYCKKVRSDRNHWQDVEVYITENTDTSFTHSICPECYNLYVKPQLDELKNKT